MLVTFRIALRALLKNKMRAGLTILGVVIGIAAVTTMVSIGQAASELVQGEFENLGTNVIIVMPEYQRRGGVRQGVTVTLTADDATAMSRNCESVAAATPIVGTAGQAIYGNLNWSPKELQGVGSEYLAVRNWGLRRGSFFGEQEQKAAAKVCVIGQTIVAELFQTTNPIGERIRIRNTPFEVIGVLEAKGANIVGDDQDNVILMPITTVQKRLNNTKFKNVHVIMASAISTGRMKQAQTEIDELLLQRHRIGLDDKRDFQIRDTTEIANAFGMVTGTMTALLAAIAGISLVVGGVGIMNIMLVSVTERTREIGIRMAVGAKSGDILRQFLVESIVLSVIGGLIGLALGTGASVGVTAIINAISSGRDWPVVVSIPAAIIAIAFAAAVGIFFGFYPARKASQLDPIDALRYE